jgi:hypothetical protein
MSVYKFEYQDYNRREARIEAIEFARYIGGKIYHDEFHHAYLVFYGSGSEKLENAIAV